MKFRIAWNAERQCWDVMHAGSTSRAARFETLLEAENFVTRSECPDEESA